MTDPCQSTKNYTQPPVPASDTLVLGTDKVTSYGPRVKPYNDGIVEPAKSDMDADFWSVYEWWPSRHATKGGWWEWRADCDAEDIARTLAEAIAGVAQAAVNDAMVDRAEENLAALQAEVESLRTDAERYRWLRKQHWTENLICVVIRPKDNARLGSMLPSLELLDDTIDRLSARAALAKEDSND